MRTYVQIMADSHEGPAFPNSSEWDHWEDRWCRLCVHDPDGSGDRCPLILAVLIGREPAEFIRQPDDAPDRYHCVEFRDRDNPGFEPEPIPDPPNQPGLFPRAPYEGARMFADSVPNPQEVEP